MREEIPGTGRLPLSENFRSQPAVLEFVNGLFAAELPDYEPLVAHRRQVALRPAVEFLWAQDAEEAACSVRETHHEATAVGPGGDETSGAAQGREVESTSGGRGPASRERLRRGEAEWIARRIRKMLDEGEKLVYQEAGEPGGPSARAVGPGDIALLFRALTNVEYYEAALQRWGIDYYLVGGRAFYAQQEIFDVLNLLRTLASPADEVSLAGVLRSPMFALHDETLFWLSRHADGLAGGLFAGEPPPSSRPDSASKPHGPRRRSANCGPSKIVFRWRR